MSTDKEGSDTMSAVARDYVYQVSVKKETKKPEPTISLEKLVEYKADIAKYLKKKK